MAPLKLLPEAVADILRLDDFLRGKDPEAANAVSILIDRGLARLERLPRLGKALEDHAGFRELALPFGAGAYVVRYRISTREVIVVRIWHSRELRR